MKDVVQGAASALASPAQAVTRFLPREAEMSSPEQSSVSLTPPKLVRGVIRRALQLFAGIVVYALILFISAGRLDWPAAWYYLALNILIVGCGAAILLSRNPGVVIARSQIRSDIEAWDKWISLLVTLGLFATLAVPGLDLRFSWSSGFPLSLQMIGYLAVVVGYAILVWAMLHNPFFEGGVRIQTDRGQTVASSGPYSFVRHPGYDGMILQSCGTVLALASWWALLAALFASAVFVLRTVLEDRTLRLKLPGYADYAQRVRYRLLPRIW